MIKGYKEGANISILNAIYHKSKKNHETNKYDKDSIDIIFKDLDTGEKKMQHIEEPEYTFYMTNEGQSLTTNELFISKDLVHPVTCKFRDIKKVIAEATGNLEYFYDNIRNGNYNENNKLFTLPNIFNADMNIEDYYRYEFDKEYVNTPYEINNLYFDIEVDGIHQKGDFPEMGECPVNALTMVFEENKTVYTLLLENDENPLINEFKQIPNLTSKLKEFVKESVGGWKQEKRFGLDEFNYKILFYNEEIRLIHDCFNLINILKPDFALAWNMAFDIPYLIERIKTLGYSPEEIICHKDFKVKEAWYYKDTRAEKFEEKGDYAQVSSYTVYMDQLITFASRRKGQRAFANFKLDYIGDAVARVRKLDYSHITTNITKLPYLNYHIFVFYNVMDTIVQKCVESKVGDVDFVYNKCMMNNTRFSKAHRQTVYLVNRGIIEFWNNGYVMGCNINKSNEKTGFPGAYVADPKKVSLKPRMRINGMPINVYKNVDDFDYKRLYPSEIFQHNMAPNTMVGKIKLPVQLDPNENKFNNEYFDRAVSFVEDFVCGNYIDFGVRYLNLASYEEMYNDVLHYFREIKNPIRGLYRIDTVSGLRCMCHNVPDNKMKREMLLPVDKPNTRTMMHKQQKMDRWDKNDNQNN